MRLSSRLAVLFATPFLALAACGGSTTQAGSGDSGTVIIPIPVKDAGKDVRVTKPDASTPHDAGVDSTAIVDAGMDTIQPPTDAERNTFPAFAPNVPQVQDLGGPVLTAPIFVPVIFAGDTYQADIEAFVATIGQSQYWAAFATEYGVGAGTSATPIILDERMPSTINDDELKTWLSSRLGSDPRFGALPGSTLFDGGAFDAGSVDATAPLSDALAPMAMAPANTVNALFLPSGTTVTMGGGQSCATNGQGFGGYHNSYYYAPNGSNVAYAVIPRCGNFGGLTGFDAISGTASHELAEAATDPYVGGNGRQAAFAQVDQEHFFWEILLGGGEVGDMCAQFPGAFYNPAEASMSKYIVQRIWSNKAALKGDDPCVPALSTTVEPFYFNTVPKLSPVGANVQGSNFTTLGVSIPAGTSTTLELDLFSNASSNGKVWQVNAYDANSMFTGSGADLVFSPIAVVGSNGDKLQMSVTNLGNDGSTTRPFLLFSTAGASTNWWIGVVTN